MTDKELLDFIIRQLENIQYNVGDIDKIPANNQIWYFKQVMLSVSTLIKTVEAEIEISSKTNT